ncbi:hypothetical protein Tco_1267250, partial [Tanacetum coccineum]
MQNLAAPTSWRWLEYALGFLRFSGVVDSGVWSSFPRVSIGATHVLRNPLVIGSNRLRFHSRFSRARFICFAGLSVLFRMILDTRPSLNREIAVEFEPSLSFSKSCANRKCGVARSIYKMLGSRR